MNTTKEIIVLTGAGQLGMAIVRRMAYGNKLFIADWKMENAEAITKTLVDAGFDAVPFKTDISSRASILELIEAAKKEGEIAMFINAAGVSPSQSTKEDILAVDLYGTAVLLEEFGKVMKQGGTGVTISSQSGHRMPALTAEEDRLLATTPTEELLGLSI
ncbi:MAG TPA: SDR family NAD(P)-dependent oxidoreductase, partial [Chitinophagaceae bacterium]|nr:SDR family NAD(P)-dependent oxidoreductase [Chitinophagaceae bacterium]